MANARDVTCLSSKIKKTDPTARKLINARFDVRVHHQSKAHNVIQIDKKKSYR